MGRVAVALAVLALLPAFVPGAMSLIGLLVSASAVILSLFSVRRCGRKYFVGALIVFVAGVLLINASLRVWASTGTPVELRVGLYALASVIAALCMWIASRLPRPCP